MDDVPDGTASGKAPSEEIHTQRKLCRRQQPSDVVGLGRRRRYRLFTEDVASVRQAGGDCERVQTVRDGNNDAVSRGRLPQLLLPTRDG